MHDYSFFLERADACGQYAYSRRLWHLVKAIPADPPNHKAALVFRKANFWADSPQEAMARMDHWNALSWPAYYQQAQFEEGSP